MIQYKKSKAIYRKKPYKQNFFIFGLLFGLGFYISGISWITNSLTFDENFKVLIPFALVLIIDWTNRSSNFEVA